LKFI